MPSRVGFHGAAASGISRRSPSELTDESESAECHSTSGKSCSAGRVKASGTGASAGSDAVENINDAADSAGSASRRGGRKSIITGSRVGVAGRSGNELPAQLSPTTDVIGSGNCMPDPVVKRSRRCHSASYTPILAIFASDCIWEAGGRPAPYAGNSRIKGGSSSSGATRFAMSTDSIDARDTIAGIVGSDAAAIASCHICGAANVRRVASPRRVSQSAASNASRASIASSAASSPSPSSPTTPSGDTVKKSGSPAPMPGRGRSPPTSSGSTVKSTRPGKCGSAAGARASSFCERSKKKIGHRSAVGSARLPRLPTGSEAAPAGIDTTSPAMSARGTAAGPSVSSSARSGRASGCTGPVESALETDISDDDGGSCIA